MVTTDQDAIETFISITGVDEATAIQKLEEHRGDLNEAVNAHFSEGDRNPTQQLSFATAGNDVMDIDVPIPVFHRQQSSLLPFARDFNPFSLLDPNFTRSIFDIGGASTRSPFVSHPKEVREIPIEVKDEIGSFVGAPIIEDVTETTHEFGPEIHGTVRIDDEDNDKNFPSSPITCIGQGTGGSTTYFGPNAPSIVDVPDYGNDIEEEMIQAAIEASKQEAAMSNQEVGDPAPRPVKPHPEDTELAHVVSLSIQASEQDKELREVVGKAKASELGQASVATEVSPASSDSDVVGKVPSNGRKSWLEVARTSLLHDEVEDEEELPLVRRRRRRVSSGPIDTAKHIEEVNTMPLSSPSLHDDINNPHQIGSDFPSDEEHNEAVMLEAAMFGGIPEGGGYHFPYAPHQFMQNDSGSLVGPYPRHVPRPPSPSLAVQRLIRERQDAEYLASFQADREKELKVKEEAKTALVEKRSREEALRIQLQEEQENERQLAAKEASLPQEPNPDDVNVVTLLVRMPDGSRRRRRFLKSDKLQCLFDFIDVGRAVKPGSYRVVRPYPRWAFNDGESGSSLDELGLSSKQEALYLELK